MNTRIMQEDGSCIVQADGCSHDFLEHITQHQAFLFDYFASSDIVFDWSFNSLKAIGAAIDKQKKTHTPFSMALANGLIAYCGEVLRAYTGGEWFMLVWPADALSGARYFPSIRTPSGQELMDFAAGVEADLDVEREHEYCRFPYHIEASLLPPLRVQKITSHPLGDDNFPPLSSIFGN